MLFRTQFTNNVKPVSNPGSGIVDKFVLSYDKEGGECLEKVGEHDLYAEIQSHRESTDLAFILSKMDPVQVSGMMATYAYDDLLNSEIIDISKLPRNAGDMLNLVKKGQDIFNGLPPEIREEWNNSPQLFVKDFGTKKFVNKIEALNSKLNSVKDTSESEVE